jgi:dGTPase
MSAPPTASTPACPPHVAATEAVLLAPHAMHSAASAGRKHAEPGHSLRGPYQRDRDRIIHSAAFRRLASKTQVFTGELGDYHRSRLTHTLEAAAIARTIGRALRLNEDLIEALTLAHDIGHPPFGHAGEDLLNACLAEVGGFSHNAQALRIVELLETRYPDFPGLNLSIEVLEGQAARADKESAAQRPLLEVQVVDAADSIAYDTHDADDALELGLVSLEELLGIPLWHEAGQRVRARYRALTEAELRRAVLRQLVDWQVTDLVEQTLANLRQRAIDSLHAVRNAPPMVVHSAALGDLKRRLEAFLWHHVYQHPQVLPLRRRAQEMLREMFDGYCQRPELLPDRFRQRIEIWGLKRTVADYLAGMTDRYAQREHRRLFGRG